MTKRVEYIDVAKALGMILVIMGHTVSSDTYVKRILYAFHMPLFFFLSGMVTKPLLSWNAVDLKAYMIKKLRAIMLPFLFCGLIYASFSFKNLALVAYGTRETLVMAGSLTSLWFLPVTFLAVILSETVLGLVNRLAKQRWVIGTIAVILLFLGFYSPHHEKFGNPLGCDIAMTAAAMMLFGHLLRNVLDSIKNVMYIIPAAVISLVVFCICVQFSTSDVGYVLMANAEYGKLLWFWINSVFGSLIVIAISYGIAKLHIKKGLLLYFGQRTLGIFIVHKPIVELGRRAVEKVGLDYNRPIGLIAITLSTIIASTISVWRLKKYCLT